MFEENLMQLGFSDRETRAYLELLRAGMQPVSLLAKRIGLNRATTYSVMKRLEHRGMISSHIYNGVRYFAANDPNALMGDLDMRSMTLKYHRAELIKVIPQLRSIMESSSFKRPVVSYFEGIDGVKNVMYDALDTSTDYFYAYMPLEKWFLAGMKAFSIEYKDLRIKVKKLPLRAIVPDTPRVRSFFEENYVVGGGLTEILYVNDLSLSSMFNDGLNIYDERVAMIHLSSGEEYGVVIESKEIAAMQRHIFEIIWKYLAGGGEVKLY